MAKRTWTILARHKWIAGAVITESVNPDNERRFTATIRGYQNWKIWQGATLAQPMAEMVESVKTRTKAIRDRIDAGDEAVFTEPNEFITGG